MTVRRGALLAVAFLVELGGLAAFTVWAWRVGGNWPFLGAILTPLLAAVLWGLFCSPRATVKLPKRVVGVVKLGFLALAVLALFRAGLPWWGVALLVIALADSALLARTPPAAAHPADGPRVS